MKNNQKLTYLIIGICALLAIIGVSIGYKLSGKTNYNSNEEINLGDACSECIDECMQQGYVTESYCSNHCSSCSSSSTATPTQKPTAVPTQKPTAVPTQQPTSTTTLTCEDYDSASECPSWCHTWGDNGCHSNPKPTATATPCSDLERMDCYGIWDESSCTCRPNPTATPTPTPKPCGAITIQGECTGEGCYWDPSTNKCSNSSTSPTATPTPTPTPKPCGTITIQGECTGEGCYWDPSTNKCSNSSTSPTATPTPTPNNRPSCDACDGNTYCLANCIIKCGAGMYVPANSNTCKACPAGSYCEGGTFPKSSSNQGLTGTCTGTNQYSYGGASSCSTCNTAINESHTVCAQCSAGYYMGENNVCVSCPAGYYCPDGVNATKCPSNKTSSIKTVEESKCYAKADESECTVKVSTESRYVSIDADENERNSYYLVKVTVNGNGCNGQYLNYYSNGSVVTPSKADNISDGSTYYFRVYPKSVDNCQDSSTAMATLKNGKSDTIKDVVTLLDDWEEDKSSTDCYYVSDEDKKLEGIGAPESSHEADVQGKNEYYSKYERCPNDPTKWGYTEHWVRGGCSSSGSGSSSTDSTPKVDRYQCFANAQNIEDATEAKWQTSKTSSLPYLLANVSFNNCLPYACYGNNSTVESSTNVVWTRSDSIPTGYMKIDSSRANCVKQLNGCFGNGPTFETSNDVVWSETDLSSIGYHYFAGLTKNQCVKSDTENPACYRDLSTGQNVWGKYQKILNYELLPITNEDDCNGNENMACYKDNNGIYYWGVRASETDLLIDDVSNPGDCGLPEVPACYLYGSEYRWGKYSHLSGYTLVHSITSEASCTDEVPACYRDTYTGSYVWGRLAENSDYVFVDGISQANCNNDAEVPKTAADVQTIIYVGIAVLIAFGLGFMYYSFNNKKEI